MRRRVSMALDDAFADLGEADDLIARQVLAGVRKSLFDRDDDPVRVDRFVVVERVGAGAMGVVYAAYDPKLDRRVALKVLSATDEGARRRALREARALARVSHPNVVTIHDAGEFEAQAGVAMELVSGTTLDTWCRAPRGWHEIASLFVPPPMGSLQLTTQASCIATSSPTNVIVGDEGASGWSISASHTSVQRRATDWSPTAATRRTTCRAGAAVSPARSLTWPPSNSRAIDPDARADQFAFCVAL